ncbi:polysaccharide deacetylase [Ammonifex degensii KC4]|uniref:Polysaccharide deacetylase n=1 Tax=Ammonifex degensii (strain DSM 10501 / KC4) TaxID=429009 RepID=C9R8T5_AMMDK|nr:polysaccharide deacetylase family protein [Ammonifex degensii]ACX52714.1 polysaccharide deacetylase [Ammonifex degensii KC4]
MRRWALIALAGVGLLGLLLWGGMRWLGAKESSARSSKAVIILMYHKVNPDPRAGGLGLRVPPEKFEWQMRYLKTHGYHVVSMEEAYDYLTRGKPLPPKPVVITFDDGYEDNYLYAWPILKRYGYPATIFLAADAVGSYNFFDADYGRQPRNQMLTWQEIKEMATSGKITFGAHTMTHPRLTKVDPERQRYEIFRCREVLGKKLGRPVDFFSYPYGDFDARVVELVKEAGFKGAVTCVQGVNWPGADPYTLKRVRVMGSYSEAKFVHELKRHLEEPKGR